MPKFTVPVEFEVEAKDEELAYDAIQRYLSATAARVAIYGISETASICQPMPVKP